MLKLHMRQLDWISAIHGRTIKSLLNLLAILCLIAFIGCRHASPSQVQTDRPKLTIGTNITDFAIHSRTMSREMVVRIIAPANAYDEDNLPVVYLLHGAGENYRTWSNNSTISDLATHKVLLVMPDSGGTYYINDENGQHYEDYFLTELIPEIHRRYPRAAEDRAHTAIVGVSRGGFGATVIALKHPAQFGYVGGLSSAFNLAERRFRWQAPLESIGYRRVFGPEGSETRKDNDPYLLLRSTQSQQAPYFYLSCGDSDVLLPANRKFVASLRQQSIPFSFNLLYGGHNWGTWAPQMPKLESSLLDYFGISPTSPPVKAIP
jgi:S-formylglutathione hydrolase FrmB